MFSSRGKARNCFKRLYLLTLNIDTRTSKCEMEEMEDKTAIVFLVFYRDRGYGLYTGYEAG